MTGKQLRNSILQWAIQGKLVPQDPNDEPASVLLERIRAEKARLIKEKKVKRDKNETIIYRGEDNSYYEKTLATGAVRCIDDEIPFDIPQGWEWARLNHITYIIEDCPHSTAKDEGIGFPLVRTPNVGFGRLILDRVHRVSEAVYRQRNARAIPQTNDLIFAREAPAGNIAVIQDGEKVCLGQRTVLVRPIVRCINPDYLAYYILSPISQQNLVDKSSGTTVAHVNLSDFRPYLVAVPPIKEQLRIIDRVAKLLPLVELYGIFYSKLENLNEEVYTRLRNSILQDAIKGKLVPQIESEGNAKELLEEIRTEKKRLVKEGKLKKSAIANESRIFRGDDNKYYEQIGSNTKEISEEIPFDIPISWRWCRIEAIFHINPKNEAEDDTEAAFVPMEAVKPGYGSGFTFQLTKWKSIKRGYTHFADGDIAFAKITPCFQNRKSVIFHNLPSGIGAGTTELKVLRPLSNRISSEYVLVFLQSPYFIDEATFKGTANQQRIINGYVENRLFPLPPIEEQRRIAHRLQELLELTL